MQIQNTQIFNAVVEAAKSKAAGNARWINAINSAVEGLLGSWITTELMDCLLVTTESGETYHANGSCQCKAYRLGQPCKHRAAAQLVKRYNEEVARAAASPILPLRPDEIRNTCVVCGNSWTANYESDYCPIHADQDPERWRPTPAQERAALIAVIKTTWSQTHPREALADTLMSRFRCNRLEMLATGFLNDIRAALAQ